MTDAERFESLKKKVDGIKVEKRATEEQVKRLSDELEQCKKDIKEAYGVEITDFAQAIETMKKERDAKLTELERLVSEAEEKMGGTR